MRLPDQVCLLKPAQVDGLGIDAYQGYEYTAQREYYRAKGLMRSFWARVAGAGKGTGERLWSCV